MWDGLPSSPGSPLELIPRNGVIKPAAQPAVTAITAPATSLFHAESKEKQRGEARAWRRLHGSCGRPLILCGAPKHRRPPLNPGDRSGEGGGHVYCIARGHNSADPRTRVFPLAPGLARRNLGPGPLAQATITLRSGIRTACRLLLSPWAHLDGGTGPGPGPHRH